VHVFKHDLSWFSNVFALTYVVQNVCFEFKSTFPPCFKFLISLLCVNCFGLYYILFCRHQRCHINAYLFQYVLHDWGDDKCIKLLKNCKQAIPSRDAGGKVIIIDIVVGSSPSDNKLLETQVLWDLYIMQIGGVERDEQEWKKIILAAGFKDYNIMPLGLRSIIELYP